MDRTIEEALRVPPDHSVAFTNEVKRLAERARQALPAPVEHVADMSYSSSQAIVLGLDAEGRGVPSLDPASVAKVVAYVSSKAKLFTILAFEAKKQTRAAKEWLLASAPPPRVREAARRLAVVLEAEGYRELSGPLLAQPAAGHVTEMDGAPARIFEVLFTEIV